MEFLVDGASRRIEIDSLVVAGWTGRDKAAVEHHIAELAAIGVKPPRVVPCFYRLSASLLTTAHDVEVVGENSSGEVEFVLVSTGETLYVGVGSDHTDRKVEAYGVTVSKQICPKPVGRELWPFAELEKRWDRLVLRSHVTRKGERRLYQEGSVSGMLAPRELLARYATSGGELSPGTAIFCGTLAVRGEIAGGERFEIELHDAVKNRSLRHEYATRVLQIAD
ncbi:MAG TPA: DUF2848 domain-containing protein [Burkholderiales bacterium]|nr:DUF2848 domain-containing protein [Burkholderiales bacterium]